MVGNITINGKLSIKGICSPVYAKGLVEKELVRILRKELNKVEVDINRRPAIDTAAQIIEPPAETTVRKRRK